MYSPEFPVSALGEFSYVAIAFQQEHCRPMDVIGTWVLSTLVAATQHMADVDVPGHGRCGLSLPFVTLMPSGFGRTSIMRGVTQPLMRYEAKIKQPLVENRMALLRARIRWLSLVHDVKGHNKQIKMGIPLAIVMDDLGTAYAETSFINMLCKHLYHPCYRVSFNTVPSSVKYIRPDILYAAPGVKAFTQVRLLIPEDMYNNVLARHFINSWDEQIASLLKTRPDPGKEFDPAEWAANMRVLKLGEDAKRSCELLERELSHQPYLLKHLKNYHLRIAGVLTLAHDPNATEIPVSQMENARQLVLYYRNVFNTLAPDFPVKKV